MRKFQRLAAAAAMAALVLVPAACTGTGTPNPPTPSSVPVAPSATPAPVPASDGVTTAAQVFGSSCSRLPPRDAVGSVTAMVGQPVAAAIAPNPLLTSFVAAMGKVAGFADALNAQNGLTLFVPDDAAFTDAQKVGGAAFTALLADPKRADTLLSHHAIGRRYDAAGLVKAGKATALDGTELTFGGSAEAPTVASGSGVAAAVLCGNIPTSNATVFVIDKVLPPQQ